MNRYKVTHWLAFPLQIKIVPAPTPREAALSNTIEDITDSPDFQAIRHRWNRYLEDYGAEWLDWESLESAYILVDDLDEGVPGHNIEHWFNHRGERINFTGLVGDAAVTASNTIQAALILLLINDNEGAKKMLATWLKNHTSRGQRHISSEVLSRLLEGEVGSA